MTADQQKMVKASFWLAGMVVLILLAISYKTPTPKRVDFDIVCERFVTPVALSLNLNHPPTQIRSLDLYGFEGSVLNVDLLTPTPGGPSQRSVKLKSFSLTGSPAEPSPHLTVTPDPAYGNMTADLKTGVLLSSSTGSAPTLRLDSAGPADIEFLLQSEAADLQESLYEIPEIFNSHSVRDKFSMHVAGMLPGVFLKLSSGQTGRGPVRANITFTPASGALQLTHANSTELHAASRPQLELFGALKPDVRIEGKSVSDIVTDHGTNFKIVPKSGRILSIRIATGLKEEAGPALAVKGSVEAKALEQDGRELLPTLVEEVLDKPYAERKYWVVFLGFAAFAIFKIVDRVAEILLKRYFPEP